MTDGTFPTVLHRFLAEMEALTPEQIAATEFTDPVARSEKEIAPLSEPLQAMHALMSIKVDQANVLIGQHRAMHEAMGEGERPGPDDHEHHNIHKTIGELRDDVDLLNALFWRSVRENYEVDPEGNGVGLRVGWLVVDIYGKKRESLFDMVFGAFLRD